MPDVRVKNLLVATRRECVAVMVASGASEEDADTTWHANARQAFEVSEEIFYRHLAGVKNATERDKLALVMDTWRDELRDWAQEHLAS